MEAEVRWILQQACNENTSPHASASDLCEFVNDLYQGDLPINSVDELIQDRRKEAANE